MSFNRENSPARGSERTVLESNEPPHSQILRASQPIIVPEMQGLPLALGLITQGHFHRHLSGLALPLKPRLPPPTGQSCLDPLVGL